MSWTKRGAPVKEHPSGRSSKAYAVVIDDMPLYRHGVVRLLGEMPGIGRVEPVETDALAERHARLPAPDLLVFGMPPDLAHGWHLLRQACVMLKPRRLLLVSDNMWLRLPPGLDARFARALSRSASLATIERDVRVLLDLPSHEETPPEPAARSTALQHPFHVLA